MGRKANDKRRRHGDPPWTPFERCNELNSASGEPVDIPDGYIIYKNSRYQVWMRKVAPHVQSIPPLPTFAWLSIKRSDRQVIHDWRDLQRIKNELIGPGHEGFEIYPAEDRLVDGANQYHLYVSLDPAWRVPIGFTERLVSEDESLGNRQRPFPKDCKPPEVK